MARPKGGTLTALFEVSEKERKEFWERQERIRLLSEESSLPSAEFPVAENGISSGDPAAESLPVRWSRAAGAPET